MCRPPTADGAAGVDAHGPHVGLIGVADAVVEGDDDADGREQKTQDQQAQNQGVQGQRASSDYPQHAKHCTQRMKIIWKIILSPVRQRSSILLN